MTPLLRRHKTRQTLYKALFGRPSTICKVVFRLFAGGAGAISLPMRVFSPKCAACVLALVTLIPPGELHAEGNIIQNGDFQEDSSNGGISQWQVTGDARHAVIETEGENRFLRLHLADQGYLQAVQKFPVDKDWTELWISARVRVQGLVKGPESHNTVTLLYIFEDAAGQHVGEWSQHMIASDQGWTSFEAEVPVIPPGAATLSIACSIMNAAAMADFDDVVVEPLTASGK